MARIGAIKPRARRLLVAVAGAPASGKSTLATDLVRVLGPQAVLVPMDGFHLDNRVLQDRGTLNRKGAPETFDATGFVQTIQRLANDDEVIVPVFDRARDLAIAGAQVVSATDQIAVIEGNYLLLDLPPWSELQNIWDLSIFVDVHVQELEKRLIRRWLDHDHTPAQAIARVRSNDLPNAEIVFSRSTPADIIV